MIQGFKPVLNSFFDAVRGLDRAVDPKLNVKTDPRVAKFQQPVPKVSRLRKQHEDAFEHAGDPNGKKKFDLSGGARAQSWTPAPKEGATTSTRADAMAHLRDGFQAFSKKPVELSPRPPPSYKAPIPVFRFR